MTFDIDGLKNIKLKLNNVDIEKLQNIANDKKKLSDKYMREFLVAVQNIIDAENQREELVKNIIAITKVILPLLATIQGEKYAFVLVVLLVDT